MRVTAAIDLLALAYGAGKSGDNAEEEDAAPEP